jgi:putative membrane protein
VVTLASVALAAAAGIVLLAGPVKDLVVTRQWIMYSLFIGLTLGGVPLVWRMARPPTTAVWVGTAAGIAVMAVLAFVEPGGGGAGERDLLLLFLAGVAGASAMVLPGVSGGYLLLVMGQYVPILSAIERARLAVPAGRWEAATAELATFVPVGLGVVVGIVGVSNLVKLLLERVPKPTLGVLLGLLLGAVLGLYPFQAPVAPSPGDTLQGSRVTAVEVRPDAEGTQRRVAVTEAGEVEVEDWPRERFTPSAAQLVSALLLVVAGFGATAAISRIGGRPSTEEATRPVSG